MFCVIRENPRELFAIVDKSKKLMTMKLENRVCVVTGSNRGIGSAIAAHLSANCGKVIVTYRKNKKAAERTAGLIGALGFFQLDISDESSVLDFRDRLLVEFGSIDVLVNNAGVNIPGSIDELDLSSWCKVIDVNLTGVFLVTKYLSQLLNENGRIVNIGSLSGEYGGPRTPSYAAAKAGVMALTHNFARHFADRSITVNCVSPGVISSELTDETMPNWLREQILPTILLKRFGRISEVAPLVTFLASSEASYITAQTFSVNGGAWVR